jgi:hypothetical protein
MALDVILQTATYFSIFPFSSAKLNAEFLRFALELDK